MHRTQTTTSVSKHIEGLSNEGQLDTNLPNLFTIIGASFYLSERNLTADRVRVYNWLTFATVVSALVTKQKAKQ